MTNNIEVRATAQAIVHAIQCGFTSEQIERLTERLIADLGGQPIDGMTGDGKLLYLICLALVKG